MNNVDVPDKLRQLRTLLGFNKKQMAEKIGVPYWGIVHCERGDITGSNQSKVFTKVKSYLELTGLQILADTPKTTQSPFFLEGHCYSIYSSQYGSSAAFERSYCFIFLRKEGIHHVFREAHGGWTRTYTDPQLIGKEIREVND